MNTVIQFPAPNEAPEEVPEAQRQEEFLRGVIEEFPYATGGKAEADVYLDYLVQKLAERRAAIARNNEVADRRVAMIESWRRQQNQQQENESRWLQLQIQAIAETYEFPKGKKSRTLPNGSFGYRRSPDTVEIVDMDRAVAFAEAHGLEIKKTVNKTPLKDHLKATGEVPDGCEFVAGEDQFFVKV